MAHTFSSTHWEGTARWFLLNPEFGKDGFEKSRHVLCLEDLPNHTVFILSVSRPIRGKI